MCKLSIVVPIYNVELYLDECLKSIERQTNKNFEVILVNDGSTDCSSEIAKKYQSTHENVKYIEQTNKGLSVARNVGIQNASGEYIVFLDSDDWIATDMVDILLNNVENGVDLVMYTSSKVSSENNVEKEEHYGYTHILNGINDGLQVYHFLHSNGEYLPCAWLYCIRKKFLNKKEIGFYPGIIHEDHLFSFELFVNNPQCKMLINELYTYRVRSNSIMTAHVNGYVADFEGMSISYQKMAEWYFENKDSLKFVLYKMDIINHLRWMNIYTQMYYDKLSDNEKMKVKAEKERYDYMWGKVQNKVIYKLLPSYEICIGIIRAFRRVHNVVNKCVVGKNE